MILFEGGRALFVAVELDHGFEIVGRDGAVHFVLGDVAVGHRFLRSGPHFARDLPGAAMTKCGFCLAIIAMRHEA